jgi:hypothetical protein
MRDRTGELSRREILGGLLGGTALVAFGSKLASAATVRARVVRVQSEGVWAGDRRDPKVVAGMVDAGVKAFFGAASADAAWKQLFAPGMRVGLKINLLGRPLIYTAREVTDAVAAATIAAGIKPGDVLVWDRYKDHFPSTAYALGSGAHGEQIVAGGDYDRVRGARTSGGMCGIDTMATQRTDVTINLPVLKDHGGAGVTLALKNIAFGAYEHHRKAHDGNCDPYIAEACAHFWANAKVPLIVLDATRGCFDGGPRPSSRSSLWDEGAIYVATDPVALDVVCRKVVMEQRVARGLRDRTRDCLHIETAARKGLGVGDPSRIDLVTVQV